MNVARINFSHGTHETASEQIRMIRLASQKTGKYIGIMLDTKGPEIRAGIFENGAVEYKQGDIVKLVKEENLDVKVMIGGAPVNQDFCDAIGADYYTDDAASASDVAKAILEGK